jgi:hypothetical protein
VTEGIPEGFHPARPERIAPGGPGAKREGIPVLPQKASAQTAVEGVPREAMERGALGHLSPAPGGPVAKHEGIPLPPLPARKHPTFRG